MPTCMITQEEVYRLLPMDACIELMEETLKAVDNGDTLQPLRSIMWLPEKQGVLGMMPSYLGDQEVMGAKIVSVFPGNHGTQFDAHQGVVLLFEAQNGQLQAVVDATSITAVRTAAVSAVATRALANPNASVLALLGSGVQARTHLEAILQVRDIMQVRVWSPNEQHRTQFAEREAARHQITVESCASAREAIDQADVICTLTSAAEPIVEASEVMKGVHINAVGSCTPNTRELAGQLVQSSRFFVDRRESVMNEAGDFLIACGEGYVNEQHIVAELGEVLNGKHSGRTQNDDITLFKSLGLAVEDLASAHFVYRNAIDSGAPITMQLGGMRDEAH